MSANVRFRRVTCHELCSLRTALTAGPRDLVYSYFQFSDHVSSLRQRLILLFICLFSLWGI